MKRRLQFNVALLIILPTALIAAGLYKTPPPEEVDVDRSPVQMVLVSDPALPVGAHWNIGVRLTNPDDAEEAVVPLPQLSVDSVRLTIQYQPLGGSEEWQSYTLDRIVEPSAEMVTVPAGETEEFEIFRTLAARAGRYRLSATYEWSDQLTISSDIVEVEVSAPEIDGQAVQDLRLVLGTQPVGAPDGEVSNLRFRFLPGVGLDIVFHFASLVREGAFTGATISGRRIAAVGGEGDEPGEKATKLLRFYPRADLPDINLLAARNAKWNIEDFSSEFVLALLDTGSVGYLAGKDIWQAEGPRAPFDLTVGPFTKRFAETHILLGTLEGGTTRARQLARAIPDEGGAEKSLGLSVVSTHHEPVPKAPEAPAEGPDGSGDQD